MHYSNDVGRGESPRLIEISENVRQFDERGHSISKSAQGNRTAKETGNQIAPIRETSSTDGVFFDAHKQKQFEIIQETNPMWDEYHIGIRTTGDIRTWAEVLELNDESEGQFVWGDFSRIDAEQALKDGTITVYSSNPIENGVFVSTSYVQAQEYAGGRNGKV